MDLSIVIPAFNEASKIGRDVTEAAAFLLRHELSGEIIVVDDGSSDDTAAVAESTPVPDGIHRRAIRYEHNVGKGHAVKIGMAATEGQYAMFADSGMPVQYEYAWHGMQLLRSGMCDVAHASRWAGGSKILRRQNLYRRTVSRIVRSMLPFFAGFPRGITDSQCGFKLYLGDVARELYRNCQTTGFMFDSEIILRARREGYRICEFPVEWSWDPDSRLHPAREPLHVLKDLFLIRWRVRRVKTVASA
jgi:dolichyl-phosphate beta-glucosyltransferase